MNAQTPRALDRSGQPPETFFWLRGKGAECKRSPPEASAIAPVGRGQCPLPMGEKQFLAALF
jgi:hypothetical protein